ncbi:MAG: heavy-metal-associated domain-containing protein [Planctomycetota bacterium]
MLRPLLLTACAVVALQAGSEEAGEPLYPPKPMERCLRYAAATGTIDSDAIQAALAEVDGAVEHGPLSHVARPSHSVFGVSFPADVTDKVFERCIKAGGRKPQLLQLSTLEFVRPDGSPIDVAGSFAQEAARGMLLGMTSHMRWAFAGGSLLSLVFEPSRTDAEELMKRAERLAAPYIEGPIQVRLLRDEIRWQLQGTVEPKRAKRLEKTLTKLPGVVEAVVDGTAGVVRVVVEFDALEVTGDWVPIPAAPDSDSGEDATDREQAREQLRPTFFVDPLLDAVRDAGFELP